MAGADIINTAILYLICHLCCACCERCCRYELFTQGPNVVVMTDVLKKASGTLSEDAIRIGSFSVQCDLNKSAEDCGAACDDMIIEADG
jgi:hypothetical protein